MWSSPHKRFPACFIASCLCLWPSRISSYIYVWPLFCDQLINTHTLVLTLTLTHTLTLTLALTPFSNKLSRARLRLRLRPPTVPKAPSVSLLPETHGGIIYDQHSPAPVCRTKLSLHPISNLQPPTFNPPARLHESAKQEQQSCHRCTAGVGRPYWQHIPERSSQFCPVGLPLAR